MAEIADEVPQDIILEKKVKKASEKISENIHIVANEPSLACYRLQEHIRKSLPQLIERKMEVTELHQNLQGKCYDLEYSIGAVKSMHGSEQHFKNIEELLKNAMFNKQQLDYDESHNRTEKKPSLSKFQRFSGSFDLPSTFLPSMTGLSSSLSVGSDLKSSILIPRSSTSPRRARASSVSSSPCHPTPNVGKGPTTTSCHTTPKKVQMPLSIKPSQSTSTDQN